MWAVRCVDFVEGGTLIETHVGPFHDRGSVDAYLVEHANRFSMLQDIELNPVPHPTALNPNQSTIADYIDPSVVE